MQHQQHNLHVASFCMCVLSLARVHRAVRGLLEMGTAAAAAVYPRCSSAQCFNGPLFALSQSAASAAVVFGQLHNCRRCVHCVYTVQCFSFGAIGCCHHHGQQNWLSAAAAANWYGLQYKATTSRRKVGGVCLGEGANFSVQDVYREGKERERVCLFIWVAPCLLAIWRPHLGGPKLCWCVAFLALIT